MAATDAAYENALGTAGFLLVVSPGRLKESRSGGSIAIPHDLYKYWGCKDTYIAQLELFAVLAAVVVNAQVLRGIRCLWCIDNTAALMSLIRGCSDSTSVDQMSNVIHTACFSLRMYPYFEYVESGSNWADKISRLGMKGAWARIHNFSLSTCTVCPILLSLPVIAVAKVVEYF